ncbi:MAG: cyclic-di-AMP receptor [Anaerolineales bacterium]
MNDIKHLMLAVVHEQDQETATRALEKLNAPVAFFASAGGFAGQRNATLLIGLHKGREERGDQSARRSCPPAGSNILRSSSSPLPMPAPVPVTVSGATIFALPVERFEEI